MRNEHGRICARYLNGILMADALLWTGRAPVLAISLYRCGVNILAPLSCLFPIATVLIPCSNSSWSGSRLGSPALPRHGQDCAPCLLGGAGATCNTALRSGQVSFPLLSSFCSFITVLEGIKFFSTNPYFFLSLDDKYTLLVRILVWWSVLDSSSYHWNSFDLILLAVVDAAVAAYFV